MFIVVYDLETSRMRGPGPHLGCNAKKELKYRSEFSANVNRFFARRAAIGTAQTFARRIVRKEYTVLVAYA